MEATAEISAGIHSYSVGRTVVGSVTPATEVGAVFDDDRSASISGSGIANGPKRRRKKRLWDDEPIF
jgi:hypothetical protein